MNIYLLYVYYIATNSDIPFVFNKSKQKKLNQNINHFTFYTIICATGTLSYKTQHDNVVNTYNFFWIVQSTILYIKGVL